VNFFVGLEGKLLECPVSHRLISLTCYLSVKPFSEEMLGLSVTDQLDDLWISHVEE